MEETEELIMPLYLVPYAVLGLLLLTGMIKCGNWCSPLRLVAQAEGAAPVEEAETADDTRELMTELREEARELITELAEDAWELMTELTELAKTVGWLDEEDEAWELLEAGRLVEADDEAWELLEAGHTVT